MQALQWPFYELACDNSKLDRSITTEQTKSNNRESHIEAVGKRHDESQIQSPALASLALSGGFDWPGRKLGLLSALPAAIDGFAVVA